MMEEIDFELCLGVEKHAANARRERITSSFESPNDATTPRNARSRERQDDEHKQEGEETCDRDRETGRCVQSNKRAKISASGSWREGDQTWLVEESNAVVGTNSSFSTSFSTSSTETVDVSATGHGSFNHDEKEQDDEQSVTYSPLSSTFRNLHIHEHGTSSSSDSGFAIYEDPEDREIRDFRFYLPEGWHSCPGDNKENTEDELYDQDEEASTEEFDSFEGVEEINYQPRRQHLDHPLRTRDHRNYYHDYQSDSPNFSFNSYTDTGGGETGYRTERTPRHHDIGSRAIPVNEEMVSPSSFREIRGAATMSLLRAPPRRFLGRGSRQSQVYGFLGV